MVRYPPTPHMSVTISHATWLKLLDGVFSSKHQKEPWEIATEAIEEWVRRHNPNGLPDLVHKGYQWKQLFLPNGTVLRTVFGGKNHHCLVEANHILYEGEPVSPSGFINAVGGIRRNAWRSIWILFPDQKEWKLADSLRTRSRPRRAPRVPAAVPRAPQAEPVKPAVPTTPPAPQAPSAPASQEHAGTRPAPAPASAPPARRAIDPPALDGRITELLRQELLPFLLRLFAMPPQRDASLPGTG